jgi:hypothetical protein
MCALNPGRGSGYTMNLPFVFVRKPDGAQGAFALRFDQLSNDCEHFRQRRSSKNQLENLEYGFA